LIGWDKHPPSEILFLGCTGCEQKMMLGTDEDSRNLMEPMPITFAIPGSIFRHTAWAIPKPSPSRDRAIHEIRTPIDAFPVLSAHHLIEQLCPISR
jgi:hypothetical protein